jgi:uncharacterized membrane protein YebE (DUF533 family)
MGLIRKAASMSTLGGVKYTSRREAQTKAAAAQGRAAREEVKLLKAQRKAADQQPREAQPWYCQRTLSAMIAAAIRDRQEK